MSDPYFWVIDFFLQSLMFEPGSIKAHVQLGDAFDWFSQTQTIRTTDITEPRLGLNSGMATVLEATF